MGWPKLEKDYIYVLLFKFEAAHKITSWNFWNAECFLDAYDSLQTELSYNTKTRGEQNVLREYKGSFDDAIVYSLLDFGYLKAF